MSALPAPTNVGLPRASARAWRNPLPAWIPQDQAARYARGERRLRAQFIRTLMAIADACNAPLPDGSLIGSFGGSGLVEAAQVHRATFFRHRAKLESLGYLVTVQRGGTVGSRNYGNVYGIPGSPGALDHRRIRREMRRMLPGADGVIRPQVIAPGEQTKLWGGVANPETATGVVANCDGGSRKLRHHQRPDQRPMKKPAGSGVALSSSAHAGPSIRDVAAADLRSDARLDLLFADAVRRGVVADCDHHRLQFWSCAEHALRVGDRPPALFASMVRRLGQGAALFVTQADEDAASVRLRRMRDPSPDTASDRHGSSGTAAGTQSGRRAGPSTDRSSPARRAAYQRLSTDARLAGAMLILARREGAKDAYTVLVRSGRGDGWDRDRWYEAYREWLLYESGGTP